MGTIWFGDRKDSRNEQWIWTLAYHLLVEEASEDFLHFWRIL